MLAITGNSYANDTMLTGTFCPTAEDMNSTSHGVFLRRVDHIPNPSRTTAYIEGNGFYAAQWNAWNPVEGDPQAYAMGNHGTLRQHNVGFADGHARAVHFEVGSRVAEAYEDGTLRYDEATQLRGGNTPELTGGRYTPDPHDPEAQTFKTMAWFLFEGPDWTNHTYPARAIWID